MVTEAPYAKRMDSVRRSFIREILKVTQDPSIISFAGGLPSPESFPTKELAEVSAAVIRDSGKTALQYSTTEGDKELRTWIAERYRAKKGLDVDPDGIVITTGSQQGLDLLSKIFLNPGDPVVLEKPGYLGAIQSFSMFEADFRIIPLHEDGPDMEALSAAVADRAPRFFYAVPNFQNPSGISYSLEKRRQAAKILSDAGVVFIEDDPYGELRFMGEHLAPVASFMTGKKIMLGTFSKICSPGFRVGWLWADPEDAHKMVTAKQASDLHTSTLLQAILVRYLKEYDIDEHIAKIRAIYKERREVMISRIKEKFPAEVKCTEPEGGMFLWITLPEGYSAMELFDLAIAEKVAFVPGKPFFISGGDSCLRLNFSNSDPERIRTGIDRLAVCLDRLLSAGAED